MVFIEIAFILFCQVVLFLFRVLMLILSLMWLVLFSVFHGIMTVIESFSGRNGQ